ncbi:hypothetical protein Q9R19_07625 [Microbacterium sp. ARD32]|uniref:hypothetical protein n=1 Tax=Microbacterium sp. ARD32 TaxID=2962577 RepID=UPI0028817852|nr:hypothetical protein [Microbacterium sp. ARD32]MDT0157487.1 hypothetical protein [Microbacterium sp. ARD32]
MSRDDVLRIGAAVPGAVLPAASLLIAVGGGMLIGAATGWLAMLGAACLLSAFVRAIGGPWLSIAVLVVVLTTSEPAGWRTAVVVLAVHLLHVLGSLALTIPLRARVALRALQPTARRFVVVQLIAQAVGALTWLVPEGRTVPAAVIGASLAVVVLAVGAVRMLRRTPAAGYPAPRESSGVR